MQYHIYKLQFTSPVHFSNGRLNRSGNTVYADTIFSALCSEALKLYGEEGIGRLYEAVQSDRLELSDAMPYEKDTLYVPMPLSAAQAVPGEAMYVPIGDVHKCMYTDYRYHEADFGMEYMRENTAVSADNKHKLYGVGLYQFRPHCGLYIIIGTEGDMSGYIRSIMNSLAYTGLGGRLSAGFGRFRYTVQELTDEYAELLSDNAGYDRYMSISVSLPDFEELSAVLTGADYEIIKRSGMISASDYADAPQRKQDLYCFRSGSCFSNKFSGNVFDVSYKGKHPVYRYAKPMFIGLRG